MRNAGILLPIFSLPSLYGIGCFGKDAYAFVDFLAKAGQSWWQILPLGPAGFGESPYSGCSGLAGNPMFIDVELLMFDGLLSFDDCREYCGTLCELQVDYPAVHASRDQLLTLAAAHFDRADADYAAFCAENADWLDDYAVFVSLKKALGDTPSETWPAQYARASAPGVAAFAAAHGEEIEREKILQHLFERQWRALKNYANGHGVRILGDIPFYIARDSSDFWAAPELFETDENGMPTLVAGCPPDYFAAEGQLWGNPLYDWPVHKKTGYAWWLRRLRRCAALYDAVRIDHFRALNDYWAVPAEAKTAASGRWLPGPGEDFIDTLRRELPEARVVAEDLGEHSAGVDALLAYSGFPGMRVLQFAFGGGADNTHLPHNFRQNCVAYTATHDNPTTAQWWDGLSERERAHVRAYLGLGRDDDPVPALIRAALASVADTCIVPLFDWLGLGPEGRINTPSTVGCNWKARVPYARLDDALAARIRASAALYGRLAGEEKA